MGKLVGAVALIVIVPGLLLATLAAALGGGTAAPSAPGAGAPPGREPALPAGCVRKKI